MRHVLLKESKKKKTKQNKKLQWPADSESGALTCVVVVKNNIEEH
jgi:hypothetical protein